MVAFFWFFLGEFEAIMLVGQVNGEQINSVAVPGIGFVQGFVKAEFVIEYLS